MTIQLTVGFLRALHKCLVIVSRVEIQLAQRLNLAKKFQLIVLLVMQQFRETIA